MFITQEGLKVFELIMVYSILAISRSNFAYPMCFTGGYISILTGDERTGDLISELQDCQNALLVLDSHRKVQAHGDIPQGFALTNIGLDCGPLAAAWLTAWERRAEGWTHARDLIVKMLDGIAKLKYGIGNNAMLLNLETAKFGHVLFQLQRMQYRICRCCSAFPRYLQNCWTMQRMNTHWPWQTL
jgi:hypothetical protein